MAIRQSKYIDITSGVGGASAVKNREFIARCLTTNEKVGIGHVLEFNGYDAVVEYFGSSSDEAKFAAKYFGFIAKNVTQAKKISFAGISKTAKQGYILGTKQFDSTLSKYSGSKSISFTLGDKSVVVDVTINDISSIDTILAAIKAQLITKEGMANATIETTEDGTIKVELGNGVEEVKPCAKLETSDLAELLGLSGNGVICSNASAGETVVEAASRTTAISDNFGTLVFLGITLTDDEVKAVADWVKIGNYKCLFAYGRKCYTGTDGILIDDNALVSLATTLKGAKSVGTTLWAFKSDDDYIEALPAALFATTDYARTNATKTFMYQQGDFKAAVTSDSGANTLDGEYVNYMGQTQFAGGMLDFSQDGVNCDGEETSVYCNEVWLKSSFWAAIMNLFLAIEKVPANEDGAIMLRTVMMDSIETAIRNGTISKMKSLNTTQKLYITNVTGNDKAWESVYTDGFYLSIEIVKNDDGKYVAKYLLVYSKGDAIRKVEGSDILI